MGCGCSGSTQRFTAHERTTRDARDGVKTPAVEPAPFGQNPDDFWTGPQTADPKTPAPTT